MEEAGCQQQSFPPVLKDGVLGATDENRCAAPLGFPGLSLRQIERADLDAWYAYLTNPDVYRHTSWNLRSPDDLLPLFDAIESTDPDSIRRLAVIDDASGVLAGTIGLHTVSTVNRSAEIAYDLAPSHWGAGSRARCARPSPSGHSPRASCACRPSC